MTILLLLQTIVVSALIGLGVAEVIKAALHRAGRLRWLHPRRHSS